MKLSTKLYGVVGTLALIGILVAGSGIWYLRRLGEDLSVATGKTAVKLDLVNASRARSWEMVAALRALFLFTNFENQQEFDANVKRWQAAFKRTGEQIRELQPLIISEQGHKDLARFEGALGDFEKASVEFIRMCREHNFERLTDVVPRIQAFASLSDQALNSLKDQQRAFLKEAQAQCDTLRAQSLFVNLLMGGLLLAVVILAVLVVRSANGTLATAVRELYEGANQVAAVAHHVSSSSQSLAQASSEQAASLQETSASSEEINSMARKNSENSGTAAGLMTQSQQKFHQTNQMLDQMVAAMGEINSHSDKISKIIKVIDEIAFQTNILALNAAVEAARAGEAGMGFAVVADEVRSLAQRCAQAAKDTAALIEESISKSGDGKGKVDQVSIAIRTITADSTNVKTLVEEVSLASQEQARGIQQIGKAIVQMEQVTQSTAANAEESAAAAEELNAQSESLKAIVGGLAVMVGAASDRRTTRRREYASAATSKSAADFPMEESYRDF